MVKLTMPCDRTIPRSEAMPLMSVPVSSQLIFTRSAIWVEQSLLSASLKERICVRKHSSVFVKIG